MKKISKLTMLLVLVMLMMAAIPVSAAKKPSATKVKRTYDRYVKENLPRNGFGICCVDLDGDGIDEMLYRNMEDGEYKYSLYRYNSGKVKKVCSFKDNVLYFNKTTKKFFGEKEASDGRLRYTEYTYKNNKIKKVLYKIVKKNGKLCHYKGNKKITKHDYDNYIEKNVDLIKRHLVYGAFG